MMKKILAALLALCLALGCVPALAETEADLAGTWTQEAYVLDGTAWDYTDATLVLNKDGTARFTEVVSETQTDDFSGTWVERDGSFYFVIQGGVEFELKPVDGKLHLMLPTDGAEEYYVFVQTAKKPQSVGFFVNQKPQPPQPAAEPGKTVKAGQGVATLNAQWTVHESGLKRVLALAGVQGDEVQPVLDAVLPIVNRLGVQAVVAENAAQLDVQLNEQSVLSIAGGLAEDTLVLVSDLFPHYAVTLNTDTIAQMIPKIDVDMDALANAVMHHLQAAVAAVSEKVGVPEPGTYTMDGGEFNTRIALSMTYQEAAQIGVDFIKGVLKEEALAPILGMIDGFDPSKIDEIAADVDEEGTVDVYVYLNMDAAGNTKEDVYVLAEITGEDMLAGLAFGVVEDEMYVHVIAGEADFTSEESMRQAAQDGSGKAMTLDGKILMGFPAPMIWEMDAYIQGVYVGEKAELTIADKGILEVGTLYVLSPDNALVSWNVAVEQGGEITAVISTEEKKELKIEELIQDEDGVAAQGLLMDVMSFGLNNVVAAAAGALPEEVTNLITMFSMAGGSVVGPTTTIEGLLD